MGSLIDAIIAFLNDAILNSRIDAVTVFKGIQDNPAQIEETKYPYIAIDDGGERTELVDSTKAQNRIYTVHVEIGVTSSVINTSLDRILSISNQVKTEFEREANRKKDGMIFGVNVIPLSYNDQEKWFFRGRFIDVEYVELEETFFQY